METTEPTASWCRIDRPVALRIAVAFLIAGTCSMAAVACDGGRTTPEDASTEPTSDTLAETFDGRSDGTAPDAATDDVEAVDSTDDAGADTADSGDAEGPADDVEIDGTSDDTTDGPSDAAGDAGEDTNDEDTSVQKLTADFSYTPESPSTTVAVTFDGSLSAAPPGAEIRVFEWDFDGDGEFAVSDSDPVKLYNYGAPGEYNATLRVEDDQGNTDTTTKTVTVSE